MAPIRVGIISLSPGQWLINSTDLVNDKNVDLVVCAIHVDRNYKTISPALKAGKDVFVEWPLSKNLKESQELLQLGKEHNARTTAAGLQGRFDSKVQTLRAVTAEGRIGKVLSSTVNAQGLTGGPSEVESCAYLYDREVSGTLLVIPMSHCLDSVREVLGDFSSFQSLISIQRPFKILKDDGSILDAKAKQIAPDQIMIHGTLKSGVVLAATFRDGAPFKDAPGLEWNILSEKEEIRIKGPSAHIQIFGLARIELHDFETDKVEKIELRKGGFDELPPVHRNSHFLNL